MRFTLVTNEDITGASTSIPTKVASATPDCRPSRLIATAKTNSKEFGLPMSGHGVTQGHAEEDIEAYLNAQVSLKRTNCEHPFTATASHT